MSDELTVTGLSIDDYETRRAEVVADERGAISSILDVNASRPTGQLTDILLERLQSAIELLQELHAAIDPDTATGQSLEAVSSITGTYRRAATKGTVELSLDLDAAITVPAGKIAAVSGDPDNEWVLTEAVTSVGAGVYTGQAEASETGSIAAPAGSISVIVTPVAGWNTVTNVSDADPGLEIEIDTELRLRRAIEIAQAGSTKVDSIQAAVLGVDDAMQHVNVYESDTWIGVSPMPPHAIEVVIWDGVAASVANADIVSSIFGVKPSGSQAYGTTIVEHTDDQGNVHQIGFTRATQVEIELDYVLVVDDAYPGDTALIAALAAWDDANVGIGGTLDNLLWSRWHSLPFELVDGVVDVDAFTWRIKGVGGYHANDIPIGDREIPTVATGDIAVTS